MIRTLIGSNKTLVILLLAVVGISACATPQTATRDESLGEYVEASFPRPVDMQFPILPFPPEYEMDRDRSFIFESGRGKIKVGGIHLNVLDTPDNVVSFYRTEMRNKGWHLIQMVDHRGTIMLFERRTQICTLTIESSAEKTLVIIHIGPK